jgi:hypothetical protein
MIPDPGDLSIVKGIITKVDAKGVEHVDQMVLEGETVEAECRIEEGDTLKVTELLPPMKIEDMATKPMTWEDVRDEIPARPSGPTKPSSPRPDNTLPAEETAPAAAKQNDPKNPTGPNSTSKGATTSHDVKR